MSSEQTNPQAEVNETNDVEETSAQAVTEEATTEAEPAEEATTEPVAETDAEPAGEATTEPVAEADTESVEEATEELVAETDTEPAEEVSAEPVAETDSETTEEVTEEPATETKEEPAAASSGVSPRSLQELKVGMELQGRVKSIELYGAFVDIGVGKDALLHISQLGTNVRNVEDVVKPGQEITVYILRVDPKAERIALSMEKPPEMPWGEVKNGMEVTGEVVRIESFGVFVDIGAERPGMIHVSELATGYVKSPSDVVSMGDEVTARVIKVNRKKRQIDLSIKALEEREIQEAVELENTNEELPTAMELALRRAMEESDDVPTPPKSNKKSRKKQRKELEDILSRTLREHSSN